MWIRPGAPGADDPPPVDRPLVSETVRLNAYKKTIRRDALKLIQFVNQNRTELYDLRADPLERHDFSSERPEQRRELRRALFSEVDPLSGGWNLSWTSDGRGRRFQGQIRTEGIFRTVVPWFEEEGVYVIERGKTLSFTDAGQVGERGLSFTTAPYEATVTFYLMIDGELATERVVLGGKRARPRSMPFDLEGAPSSESAFSRPPSRGAREVGFTLWRTRPAGAEQSVILDDSIRERLESLGYMN